MPKHGIVEFCKHAINLEFWFIVSKLVLKVLSWRPTTVMEEADPFENDVTS